MKFLQVDFLGIDSKRVSDESLYHLSRSHNFRLYIGASVETTQGFAERLKEYIGDREVYISSRNLKEIVVSKD